MEMYLNKEETILVRDLIKLEMKNQLEFQFLSDKDTNSKVENVLILMDCYKDVDVRLINHLNKLKSDSDSLANFPESVIELMELVFVETVKGDIPDKIKSSLEKNFNNILNKIRNSLTNKNSPKLKINMIGIGLA